jgi:hypothetical protein
MAAKVFSPNGVDIGRRLLSAGMTYRRYSTDYVAAENEARNAGAGSGGAPLRLGAGRDATAGDWSAFFQLVGLSEGGTSGPAVPGCWQGRFPRGRA